MSLDRPWPVLGAAGSVAKSGGGLVQISRVPVVSPKDASRVTVYLHPDEHRELWCARMEDEFPITGRIRALVALWRDDPELRDRVAEVLRSRRSA